MQEECRLRTEIQEGGTVKDLLHRDSSDRRLIFDSDEQLKERVERLDSFHCMSLLTIGWQMLLNTIGRHTIVEERRGRWQTVRVEFQSSGIVVTTSFGESCTLSNDRGEVHIQSRIHRALAMR